MLINERISIDVQDNIALVKLSRPEKMNALDAKTFAAIPEVNQVLRNDPSIRVVVLDADGDNFCSGLDKSNFESMMSSESMSTSALSNLAQRTHGIANDFQYAAWMWRELPMPVLVAVKGVAFGGGLQIALGGDMRYISADSRFSILEMKWGIVPDMSSSQIMRHLVADDIVRELTYTARVFNAEDAVRWGFATQIVDDPSAHALSVAEEIASKNPHAVRAAKQIIDASYYQSAAEGLLNESQQQDQIIGKPNQVEAIMSVLQKRAPNFID